MARGYPDQLGPGAYVPIEEILDPTYIEQLNVNKQEFKDFLNKLTRVIGDMNRLLNLKDTGYYPEQEFVNSQLFFPNPALSSGTSQTPTFRNVFRKVINYGILPNNAVGTPVAHGIDVLIGYTFTRMYGCASVPGTSFVAIPNSDIKLTADATNINITTTSVYAGYTITYIVVEFIKS